MSNEVGYHCMTQIQLNFLYPYIIAPSSIFTWSMLIFSISLFAFSHALVTSLLLGTA